MREDEKTYRKGPDEGTAAPNADPSELSLDRRDFLRATGFVIGAAALTGCQQSPVEKVIPFLEQAEGAIPGKAWWLASTCGACTAGCGVVVKVRDGRPIKLEGNPDHPVSRGGLCAVGQAAVLELYDSKRIREPLAGGKASEWKSVDAEVMAKLAGIRESGGSVRLLTATDHGPTTRAMIARFAEGFTDVRHVICDSLSSSAIADAHEATHGVRAIPRYRFDRASVIASFDADFLGTWISPVEYAAGWAAGRALEGEIPAMSWHVQFESRMSLTGSKADSRSRIRPRDIGTLLSRLLELLRARSEGRFAAPKDHAGGKADVAHGALNDLAERLFHARGQGLVVCGSQRVSDQVLVNRINELIGSYGTTVDLTNPAHQRRGSDRDLESLLAELRDGKVDALFIRGVNPVEDLPSGAEIAELIARVPLVVTFSLGENETTRASKYALPDPHFLECWSDHEAIEGVVAVGQPSISPTTKARPFIENLARWSGDARPAYDLIRETWERDVYTRSGQAEAFTAFWDRVVHDGYATVAANGPDVPPTYVPQTSGEVSLVPAGADDGSFDLVLYPKIGMLAGQHSSNPWLHELPDPVTKVTWDNYASLSTEGASMLGVRDGDIVRISPSGGAKTVFELPAFVQPGQHDGVVAIALGYGRAGTERFSDVGPRWIFKRRTIEPGERVGVNASPMLELTNGELLYHRGGVRIERTGRRRDLASTQLHHSLHVPDHLAPESGAVRPIVQETTFAAWKNDPRSGEHVHHDLDEGLWADHAYTGHHWGMAIDLSACTGCSGCVVGCQAENNVPVVGKDEVLRQREMHWMRIDRYYAGEDDGVDVVHQPMLCQHCDHAPCETVCPVLATVHSSEGLNQQVYNRCVGTRYCANNCPYKTRRFNWFDYPHEDRLANLVLNPDVTVRSRGVMEKCSFCVQRIQDAKADAKSEGRVLADGEIRTACQQSCPTQAIVFGDLNDPESRVSKLMKSGRNYRVLEELNVRPSVGYLRVVRNRDEEVEHG